MKKLVTVLLSLLSPILLAQRLPNLDELRIKCNQDDGKSCINLADIYYDGKGVERSYHDAVVLYQKACELGEAVGCNSLGYLYENGQGVKQSYKDAFKLYQRACGLKGGLGCNNLGVCYEIGQGVR